MRNGTLRSSCIFLLAVALGCGGDPVLPAAADAADAQSRALDDALAEVAPGDAAPVDGTTSDAPPAEIVAPGPDAIADAADTAATLPDAATATGAVPLAQFEAEVLDALCAPAACQASAAGIRFAAIATCKAYVGAAGLLPWAGLVAKAQQGELGYDPVAAAACVAHLLATCHFEAPPAKPAPACAATFVGTAGPGAACAIDDDCASDWCDRPEGADPACAGTCAVPAGPGGACATARGCQGTLLCVAGQCQPDVPLGLGQPCGEIDCADGLFCDATLDAPTCQPLGVAGQPCPDASACQPGLTCVFGDTLPATCAPVAKLGQPCSGFDPLTGPGGGCEPGLVCATLDPESDAPETACLPKAALGAPCQVQVQCGSHDTVCQGAGPAQGGVCALVPKKGEPCNPAPQCCGQALICFPGLVCDPASQVCVDAPGVAKPCVEDQCGPGLTCFDEVCTAPAAAGEKCEEFGAGCVAGQACVDGKCAAPVCP